MLPSYLIRYLIILFIFNLAACSLENPSEYKDNNPYDPFSEKFNDELYLGYWENYNYKFKKTFKYYNILPSSFVFSSYLSDNIYLFGGNIYNYAAGDVNLISMGFISDDTLNFEMEVCYPMIKTRREAAIIYWPVSGDFYIFGGDKEATYEKYSRWDHSNQDTTLYFLPDNRLSYGAESIIFKNYILLIGGESALNDKCRKIWVFEPDSLKWFVLDTLPLPISFTSSKIIENKLYLFGGFTDNNQPVDKIFIYDFFSRKWESFPKSLPDACGRIFTVAELINDEPRVYCFGGYRDRSFDSLLHNNFEIKLGAKKIIRKKDIPLKVKDILGVYKRKAKINVVFQNSYYNVSVIYFHLPYF